MKEYCKKSRNLHTMQEEHVFCPCDGISSTPTLPSANADIMATSMLYLPTFPTSFILASRRLEPLKNSLSMIHRQGEQTNG
jgi:hypothetical protein